MPQGDSVVPSYIAFFQNNTLFLFTSNKTLNWDLSSNIARLVKPFFKRPRHPSMTNLLRPQTSYSPSPSSPRMAFALLLLWVLTFGSASTFACRSCSLMLNKPKSAQTDIEPSPIKPGRGQVGWCQLWVGTEDCIRISATYAAHHVWKFGIIIFYACRHKIKKHRHANPKMKSAHLSDINGQMNELSICACIENEIRKGFPRFRTPDLIVCRNVENTRGKKEPVCIACGSAYGRHNEYDELGLLEKIDNFLCMRFSSTIQSSESIIVVAVFISSIS